MSETTSNQDLAIVTNGTDHTATTMGATDVCKLPINIPAPFPNFIQSQGNVINGTTNTFIVDQSVMHQSALLGPVSDPGHPGVNKGVGSGAYRDVAAPTSWSKDVMMEGQLVVRTSDSTTQNKANTTGTVTGGSLNEVVQAQDQYDQKLCTITELVGTCGHGRKLGPPPGKGNDDAEPNYLEILEGDSVNFISTRKDVTKDVIDPKCVKGIHTHWDVKKTGGSWAEAEVGMNLTETDTDDAEKEYDLESPLTGESDDGSFKVGKTGIKKEKVTNFQRRRRATGAEDAAGRKFSEDYGEAITHKTDKDSWQKKSLSFGWSAAKQAALLWDAAANPREIVVEACACSGKKNAKIRVLPKAKIDLDLFDDSVKAMVKVLQKALDMLEYAGSLLGAAVRIKLFDGAKLKFGLEYKELTEDKPLRPEPHFGMWKIGPHYRVQCRKAWSLELSFDPLFQISVEFDGPITAAIPMIGPAAVAVLKLIGAKADFFLKGEASLTAKGSITWDEYDEIVADGNGVLNLTFSVGVKVFITWAEVTLYAYVKFDSSWDKFGPRPGYIAAVDWKNTIQLGIKGAAKVNFWYWQLSKDIDYKPEWAKWEWKGTVNLRKNPGTYLDAGSTLSTGNVA